MSTRLFASLWLTAWKLPMGLPNCTRSMAYCLLSSSDASALPSRSAAISTVQIS